jgi:hypothetical protein
MHHAVKRIESNKKEPKINFSTLYLTHWAPSTAVRGGLTYATEVAVLRS